MRTRFAESGSDRRWFNEADDIGGVISIYYFFHGDSDPVFEWIRLAGTYPRDFKTIIKKGARIHYPHKTLEIELMLADMAVCRGSLGWGFLSSGESLDSTDYLRELAEIYGDDEKLNAYILAFPFFPANMPWKRRFMPGTENRIPQPGDLIAIYRNIGTEEEYITDYFDKLISGKSSKDSFLNLLSAFGKDEIRKKLE